MGKSLKLIIEALLFASDKPLTAKDIHNILANETRADISEALKELQNDFDNLDRSFVLRHVANGFQFRTKQAYASFVLQMLKTTPTRLSRAAMETLAIIAYKQPLLRQEIERVRGVDVGGILRTLLEKNLIRIMGRKNLPGKPLIYGTTKKFLEVFDLKDLNSLPKMKEIKELSEDETHGTPIPEEPASLQLFQKEKEDAGEAEPPAESVPDTDAASPTEGAGTPETPET